MPIIDKRMMIPAEIHIMITDVVNNDEGGWKLNPPDANDQDGGWTFGGITSKLYNECYTTSDQRAIDKATLEHVLSTSEGRAHMIEDCTQIYFQKFCVPLSKLDAGDMALTAMELSCFINVGDNHFIDIIRAAGPYGTVDYKNSFLAAWRQYYCHLVAENAKAWMYCAVARKSLPDTVPPATLRAIYLAGWIARVDKYAF